MLSVDDFAAFFKEIHGHDPFPWQHRLVTLVASQGAWPEVLDLPTGTGKTAAIDVAIFHLALEADRKEARRAPVRVAFVVDRRLIVDDAYARASRISVALHQAQPSTVAGRVAERLKALSGDGRPLLARRLRGGIPREDDWARTPSQPTVLCSTVDQVGSRLLFRGYGVSDSMKPVHAGLIGSDCLILLDEAHLAEPFRQTLNWIGTYRSNKWREVEYTGPWGVSLLTATPGVESRARLSLNDEDRSHPVLKRRLEASKPARLLGPAKNSRSKGDGESVNSVADSEDEELGYRVETIVSEVRNALGHFAHASDGALLPAVGVVVNRVNRARKIYERIWQEFRSEIEQGRITEPLLVIGPARPVDRDSLAGVLEPIRTRTWKSDEKRLLDKPVIIVATQCIEAGVDIDLDALVTEAAPLDALRQRFGRLNRAGREITPYAAIIAGRSELQTNYSDPVYGNAIKFAWERLIETSTAGGRGNKKENIRLVDFGVSSFTAPVRPEALSPRPDAPVLIPAHVDLLSQTAPIPAADPTVSLYLHGIERQSDSIAVVWRGDIDPETHSDDETRRLLKLVPPRSGEAIELPDWAVRRWLNRQAGAAFLADVAAAAPEDNDRRGVRDRERRVFRWKGDDVRSQWIDASALRPGDTIVVPARYGGADAFGWNPSFEGPTTDLGRKAADAFVGRRLAVRIAPGLLQDSTTEEALAEALAGAETQRWRDLREAVMSLPLPDEILRDLRMLNDAKSGRVVCYLDLYGTDDAGRPRGILFLAPFGIKHKSEEEDGCPNTTEDDAGGSMPGFRLSLARHSEDVATKAAAFSEMAGMTSARIADLKLAGFLHDAGKADPRFQAWLRYGDPLGIDPDEPAQVLAKSDRPLPTAARQASGLPANWRHEALSVRLALLAEGLSKAHDPELVLWLVGTHHGYGRPFFPHVDPADAELRNLPPSDGLPSRLPPGHGPQSLAFDWRGADWPTLFERLKARYGVWELARMEATLRLADHRASEDAARYAQGDAS